MTTTNLIAIISSGGNVIIDASKYTSTQLISLVSTAHSSNTTVYIKNSSKFTQSSLISIASAGHGAAIFDLTE